MLLYLCLCLSPCLGVVSGPDRGNIAILQFKKILISPIIILREQSLQIKIPVYAGAYLYGLAIHDDRLRTMTSFARDRPEVHYVLRYYWVELTILSLY